MKYISQGAIIQKNYRYLLWREWRGTHDPKHWNWLGEKDGAGQELGDPSSVLFIMLNPSTADGEKDDPTIRRCVNFAKAWNYERVEVVNLFAYRTSSPDDLFRTASGGFNVEGPQNQKHVQLAAASAGLIIAAWGARQTYGQDETMLGWLDNYPLYTLGLTKLKLPIHPLYVSGTTKPKKWIPWS
jgi:hypothetical protein